MITPMKGMSVAEILRLTAKPMPKPLNIGELAKELEQLPLPLRRMTPKEFAEMKNAQKLSNVPNQAGTTETAPLTPLRAVFDGFPTKMRDIYMPDTFIKNIK